MFETKSRLLKRSTVLWCVGLPALLALNVHRDMMATQRDYRWLPVTHGHFYATQTVPGMIETSTQIDIKADRDGAVEKTTVAPGQEVRQGQTIIEFSRVKVRVDVDQKNQECAAYDADIRKYRKRLETQKKLLRRNAIDPSYLSQTRRLIEENKQKLETARQERKKILEQARGLSVRAPFNGTMLVINVKDGQVVMAGDTLARVADNAHLIFRGKVDDKTLRRVALGEVALVTADGDQKQATEAVVGTPDQPGMLRLEISGGKKTSLRPGTPAHALVRTDDTSDAIAAPLKAVLRDKDDETFIMVRNKWGWVRRRPVTLGPKSEELVQVLKGLELGDAVGLPSTDTTDAGAEFSSAGGDSTSMDTSSVSKNRSSRDHSLTNKP
jgi:RND family efflux transporter MFP subunit